MVQHLLIAMCGGAIGTGLRFLVAQILAPSSGFPWQTFVVNLLGSAVLGAVLGSAERGGWSSASLIFLGTGICGGFTTFSAISAETFHLLHLGQYTMALTYSALTLAGGILLSAAAWLAVSASPSPAPTTTTTSPAEIHMDTDTTLQTATVAGGCFWCVEAVFQRLEGVDTVISGYSGGTKETADYKTVCTGTTQHAEACQISFNPAVISYEEILQVFFSAHDPTTLNRQGNDVGPQYRSAIFYHSDEQRTIAEAYIQQLNASHTWPDPIVTEVVPYEAFYVAEDYHQNYFNQNGAQPYCAFVVRPKVEKFMKAFKDRVKPSYRAEE